MIPPNLYDPPEVSKSILPYLSADQGSSPETYHRANHQNQQVGPVPSSGKLIGWLSCDTSRSLLKHDRRVVPNGWQFHKYVLGWLNSQNFLSSIALIAACKTMVVNELHT